MLSNKYIKALKSAVPHTIPVFAGYIVLGSAYGLLMESKNYSLIWVVLTSIFIYAGSMQFVSISLIAAGFHPLNAALVTIMVNARHIFYGISMLSKFKGMGKKKWYLMLGLTDETFSILCAAEPPKSVDKGWFMFFVTLLDHIYWITGSILGSILGNFIPFNTTGIDFVLTALFVVIFIEQLLSKKSYLPVFIGVGSAIICRLLFGTDFLIPTMILILILVTLLRKYMEEGSVSATNN
jgi:branched chain amino acid efflux pump